MYNYIIVGQGLAGTILAYTFERKGKKILVINDEDKSCASLASAGIFNPITGKRMTKTWRAEKLFPFLIKFYKEMEAFLNISILQEMPVYKPFSTIFEQNEWLSKASENDYLPFIDTSIPKEKYAEFIDSEAGGFETRISGTVDVSSMLNSYRQHLKATDSYLTTDFSTDKLKFSGETVTYDDKYEAEKIIFCDGYRVSQNPFFNWVPFTPTKGETLKIEIKNARINAILNKSGFVVPIKDGNFIAGSTYDRFYSDELPSEKGLSEVTEKVGSFLKPPYQVLEHKAGIRPAVSDRKPVIGMHPEFKTIAIFNGLGTKGVSLAPYFAYQFSEFLEAKGPLEPEVNLTRFSKLYPGFRT